jgi:hypothetical protein
MSRLRPEDPGAARLLDLVPVPLVEWESSGEEKVVLLVPKFRQRHLAKYLLPLLAKPKIRVHLDDNGSAVWAMFDGAASVGEISRRAQARFGGDESDWADRVTRFVRRLEKERFIGFAPPGVR